MSVCVLKPTQNASYDEVVKVFADMYKQVVGTNIEILKVDDEKSDLVVIGSDAVNDFVMNEIFENRLDSLNIRYGTDDYLIRTYNKDGRKVLLLAGGRVRSTLYAIYHYFESYLGCHYFWDGDIIPHADSLPMDNINVAESPRFEYRGLRYFAHRGLKRFQAEHWSFEDWKQEIDWMVKKRLNFFMLRIGMDDVWQRAFPDEVPYPEDFRKIKGGDANGYDDRSDFWNLKYRGALREKILEYARKMDLTYPTDCGTMTHWYSRTPEEFLKVRNPQFLPQADNRYNATDTGKVWDFRLKENMDNYMHLTETMVNNYEKRESLFHSIGLGERRIFADKDKNFKLKLFAYRRIAESLRQRYPDSKLMLASWDFIGWWTPEEVQELVKELDPERTIILDYTSEVDDPNDSFINWGVVGKFPWVFGLFHAYESESELRGPYDRSDERLKIAANDPYCKGMIFWPELSHSDPLVLEYLCENSWSPLKNKVEQIAEKFCQNRYGKYADCMNKSWQLMLPFIKQNDWGGYSRRKEGDEKYTEYTPFWSSHQDIWSKMPSFLEGYYKNERFKQHYMARAKVAKLLINDVCSALKGLADKDALKDKFVLRDSVDMVRTALGRFMNFLAVKALVEVQNKDKVKAIKEHYLKLMDVMAEVLSLNDDFSILKTLEDLQKTAPTNPEFETTLKRNISCNYCSQAAYELVEYVYKKEGVLAFDWLIATDGVTAPGYRQQAAAIHQEFIDTSLKKMQPKVSVPADSVILKAASSIEKLVDVL